MLVGAGQLIVDLPASRLLAIHRQPAAPAITDVAGAMRDALENPLGFPALRRALTPDDQVAIVVDEHLPDLPGLLAPLLDHLAEARIPPEAITFLRSDRGGNPGLTEQLQANFPKVKVEDHDPENRKRLSYLATTKRGRRMYLNRTAIDADQLVVLSRRFYDPILGFGGAEGAVYPGLSDAEAQRASFAKLSMAVPGEKPWPIQQEAAEVAWLLGAPFFVQIIEGAGDEICNIVAGLIQTSAEGQRLLNARWRVEVDNLADVVIAQVSGDSSRHTFPDLARAAASASRVVAPEGRIVVVSGGTPDLGPGAQMLRQADTASQALHLLEEQQPADLAAAFQWASAARCANIYLLSRLPSDVVEELFATLLEQMDQIARLVGDGSYLLLPDADKTLAVVK
jgi:nickel-dependent lactate racemase